MSPCWHRQQPPKTQQWKRLPALRRRWARACSWRRPCCRRRQPCCRRRGPVTAMGAARVCERSRNAIKNTHVSKHACERMSSDDFGLMPFFRRYRSALRREPAFRTCTTSMAARFFARTSSCNASDTHDLSTERTSGKCALVCSLWTQFDDSGNNNISQLKTHAWHITQARTTSCLPAALPDTLTMWCPS